jgi:hypothetical protein
MVQFETNEMASGVDGQQLNFQYHLVVIMTKAKMMQGRVKGITRRLRLKPENAKKVQIAAV